MKYRYNGSAFVLDVKPGETISEVQARLRVEQASVDKPAGQLLKAQVTYAHALHNLRHAESLDVVKHHLTVALDTLASAALALRREP